RSTATGGDTRRERSNRERRGRERTPCRAALRVRDGHPPVRQRVRPRGEGGPVGDRIHVLDHGSGTGRGIRASHGPTSGARGGRERGTHPRAHAFLPTLYRSAGVPRRGGGDIRRGDHRRT